MPFSDFLIKNKLRAMGVNPTSGAGGPSTPGGVAAQPGLYSQLFGTTGSRGEGGFTPEQQRLLGIGTSLLSGSQSGQQDMNGSGIQQQLLSLLLNSR